MCSSYDLVLSPGTATVAGSDYVMVSDTLMFPTSSVNGATRCIDITIGDDGILEAEETFTVTLTISTTNVALGVATTTVTITDDG